MFLVMVQFFGLKIYAYDILIMIGIALAGLYLFKVGIQQIGLTKTMVINLLIFIIIAAAVGGKFFLFLEYPSKYLSNPSLLLSGSKFVFYDSLIFCFGVLYWYTQKHHLSLKLILDVIAVATCIVHLFYLLGFFWTGCNGNSYDGFFSISTTNNQSVAPLNCLLQPVQLYEVIAIFLLLIILLVVKRLKKFDGQLHVTYLLLYSIVRIITHTFKADEERDYLFYGLISHSQFISLSLMTLGFYLFFKWRNNDNIG